MHESQIEKTSQGPKVAIVLDPQERLTTIGNLSQS